MLKAAKCDLARTLVVALCLATPATVIAQAPAEKAGSSSERQPSKAQPEFEEILVIGTRQERYIVESSDALTGIELDFLENPRNITILPEQLLLDRKITTLEEALRNVPGISAADGFGGTRDDFYVRGFRRNATYRNGFRRQTFFRTNVTNIEYTQVIGGPASVRYGRVEPGGVVDLVTKRPLAEQRIAGELRYGSFSDALGLIDVSQPLTDRAAMRVVASIQDSESFRDFYDVRRESAAISGHYDFTDSTRLELSYEYRDESRPLDRGTIAVATPDGFEVVNELLGISDSRRFGDPFEEYQVYFNFLEATFNHAFNERWRLRLGAAYEDSTSNDLQSRPQLAIVVDEDANISDDGFITGAIDFNGVYDEPGDRVFLFKGLDGNRNRTSEVSYLNLLVTGEFDTASFNHRVSFGGDYRDSKQTRQFVTGERTDGNSVPLFNIEQPLYTLSDEFSPEGVPVDEFTQEDYGIFANVYTKWTERLGTLLGVRYSEVESENFFPGFDRTTADEGDAVTPMAGLSLMLRDNIALFASYSESFQPNNVFIDSAGVVDILDPELAEQIELGVKAEFFDGRAQSSLVLFEIEKTDVVIGADEFDQPILANGASSEGVTLSFAGQPRPGMNIVASYAYIDAQTSEGGSLPGVADQLANVYVSYEWQEGGFEGVGVGGGVYYEAERPLDALGLIAIDDYTLVDVSAWYTIQAPRFLRRDGTVRFQLALKNIFDEEYYGVGSGTPLRIPIGTPRTVTGSVSFDL
ncbi:MAG: TonB-dependent siderophore receptor [Pseudomonadota bacterium]